MEDTIGGIAVKLMENKLKSREKATQGLLVLGSKGAGKSTLVNVLLEREEARPKETLGLEYTYVRRGVGARGGEKGVCGVWEAGGLWGASSPCPDPSVVLVVLHLGHSEGQLGRALLRFQPLLSSPPAPLYLVGGHYDLFKRAETVHRAKLNRMLRACALLTKCGVFMFSNQEPSLIKRVKDILGQLAFGAPGSRVSLKPQLGDVDKPLQVPWGGEEDSWAALGCEGPLEWGVVLGEGAPGGAEQEAPAPDPSLDAAFREPLVDALRSKKDHQLQLLLTSRGHADFL